MSNDADFDLLWSTLDEQEQQTQAVQTVKVAGFKPVFIRQVDAFEMFANIQALRKEPRPENEDDDGLGPFRNLARLLCGPTGKRLLDWRNVEHVQKLAKQPAAWISGVMAASNRLNATTEAVDEELGNGSPPDSNS